MLQIHMHKNFDHFNFIKFINILLLYTIDLNVVNLFEIYYFLI